MNSSSPLLSIITPAYNAGEYLPALIASVETASSGIELEWILVDDGSTDNTAEIFQRHARHHPRWRLVQQVNQGLATTRNNGLELACGSYVWFVDADDLITSNSLSTLVAALAAFRGPVDPLDMLGFQACKFGEQMADQSVYRYPKSTEPTSGHQRLTDLIEQKELRHFAWIYWYRREFLQAQNLRFIPGLLHEDIAFTTEALLRAKWVGFSNCLAYRYRINPASLTGLRQDAALIKRIESYFLIVERLRKLILEVPAGERTQAALKGEIIGQALQVFELAKQLEDLQSRKRVLSRSRELRFVERLFSQIASVKRLRQVCVMWLKQLGLVPLGKEASP